ncbi:polyunsaturated fatty acid 5-lipoxygenase-like [Tubulanus polymorphus]|uniref:polyunsaturated fatty acid 5-lipoxygenase-like n=1 Tax=Tubulanus polymorphus TaxID=672921 RepID=UPI003DA3CF6D
MSSNGSDSSWINRADEFYREINGDEDFKLKSETQFKFQKPGFGSGLNLWFESYKWKVAFSAIAASGRRPVHRSGIGVSGFVTIRKHPELPEDDFFTEGKIFQLRGRFSSDSPEHDAVKCSRGFTIRFTDGVSDDVSSFDLICSTGSTNSLICLREFGDFADAFPVENEEEMKNYCLAYPFRYRSIVDSHRRAPDSFAKMIYHCHTTYSYQANDGMTRTVRFRFVPKDLDVESGLTDEQDQREPWNRKVRDEHKNRDESYLNNELIKRFETDGSIDLDLQIQIREGHADDYFNVGLEWNSEFHPWRPLADVVLTTPLPLDISEPMTFDLANRPPILTYHKPASVFSFTSVSYAREKIYPAVQRSRQATSRICLTDDGNFDISDYILLVKTADMGSAGTDRDFFISLNGTQAVTKSIKLDHTFHDDFKKGRVDAYKVSNERDVGQVRAIEVSLRGRGQDDHAIDYVIVFDCSRKKSVEFPCYSWLRTNAIFQKGDASLCYQEKDAHLRNFRKLEVQWRREQFPWRHLPGLSSSIDHDKHNELPRDVQFNDEKSRDFFLLFGQARLRYRTVGALMSHGFTSLKDYRDFANICQKSEGVYDYFYDHFWDDAEYGRHFLTGTNPHHLRRCTELPNKLAVDDGMLKPFLDRGKSLDEEIKDGHVYILDYSDLTGIPRYNVSGETRYVAEPIALLYVRKSGHLVPIAIQLQQTPGPNNPVFLPSDSQDDWTLAKIHVKCADSQIHQMYYHLSRTHFIIEAIAVATMRQLPSAHPVFKMLIPHMRHTIAINTIGRVALTGEGKVVDNTMAIGGGGHIQYISKLYSRFNISELFLKQDMKNRGVDDPEKLPFYHFREDGYLIWDAIHAFVVEMTSLFYKSDNDVVADEEIQAWLADLRENGFRQYEGHEDHGIPERFETKRLLDEWITMLIFSASCQHAAVNFNQMDYMAFVPNYPLTMLRPPPTEKGVVNMDLIIESLPNWLLSANALAAVYPLSQYSSEEIFLGEYPNDYFTDLEPRDLMKKFSKAVKQISATIHERNKTREVPYVYLLPERVPSSIAI